MFFLHGPKLYINLKYVVSIDKSFCELKMINEDEYIVTEEEANKIIELLNK